MGNEYELPSPGLCTDVLWWLNVSFAWDTQGQSEICPEVVLAVKLLLCRNKDHHLNLRSLA